MVEMKLARTSLSTVGFPTCPPFPYLRFMRAALLKLKPSRTPKLMISQRILNGTAKAIAVRMTPEIAVPLTKAPFLLCLRKIDGSSESRDIAAVTSGCGRMERSTTRGNKMSSPMFTRLPAQAKPLDVKADRKSMFSPVFSIKAAGSTIEAKDNCAKVEINAAPARVPSRALGIVFAGSLALEARQQTSSNPMKPKNNFVVPSMVPATPCGKKTSADAKTLCDATLSPAITMKAIKATFANVIALITGLPTAVPAITTSTQRSTRPAAATSK
mmetsp:Transcript_24865/g.45038  ORF Transcript_24865/g.45038 Transcript_24865/m.45038 type:complete len:272 (-) Transcript_24865:393-1208(-)